MSIFTKRRKKSRTERAERFRRSQESCVRMEQTSKDMIEAMKQAYDTYPNYEDMDAEERIKIFAKIYNTIHNA